jgi:hypothetical protein
MPHRLPTSYLAAIMTTGALVIFLYFMNVKGIEYLADNSIPMTAYVNASEWLSRNLNINEIALVPQPTVFYSLNPEHKHQFKDYKILWDAAEITRRANTTENEVQKVRSYLEAVIQHEPRLKYLVVDWLYPYSSRIFKSHSCSDLGDVLYEVKRFGFQTPFAKWNNKVLICGINSPEIKTR